MTEEGALALLPFSLDPELSDHRLGVLLKSFVLEQSVVELMMTKELVPPNPFREPFKWGGGGVWPAGWRGRMI